ncbi:NAD(P)H-hydrate dehydratase [Cecembia rubra]|uniref:Bifunctional NAD(P)H-hydrate repair enzyme n=1 Tax=Cecembia rubra TaxID=1485585 RepID=A0A2P8DL73_9BACT|nr:NAD(P)H-hydrate dehydratase [Cecembia rubra]PSK97948.1 NAD(P)H-hydrate epimerase [Cecembia rubra]
MLSIISGDDVKKLDAAFIKATGISSWDLMENAAKAFFAWYQSKFMGVMGKVFVFSGPGNNGGDGIAIARLLAESGKTVSVIFFQEKEFCSKDYTLNIEKLPSKVNLIHISDFNFEIDENDVVLDCIFGIGINRPLEGSYLEVIERLNKTQCHKVSIDIPSGIPSDEILQGKAFKADHTVTFQFPKLSLLFPEHSEFTGNIHVVDIGIPDFFIQNFHKDKFFLRREDIRKFHKKFNPFSHKGDFGRIMLIGGSVGKVGAMVLSSKAALRTGSGLVHVQIAESERFIMQTAVPEVMVAGAEEIKRLDVFDALGIGPGWGTEVDLSFYCSILKRYHKPLVIDADGLNLLSKKPENLKYVPKGSILTPHIREFQRLAGEVKDHKERLDKARSFALEHGVYLVLKGAFTSISTPNGEQYFNSSGNQYLATAGSGDVLTGMIASFLGQGYLPLNAAICGVFQHGLAGEMTALDKRRGVIASDIIDTIPATFVDLDIE